MQLAQPLRRSVGRRFAPRLGPRARAGDTIVTILAELGFGELAKRRDPTWASSVLIERYDETIPAEEPDAEEPREQLIELLRRDLDSRAVSDQDRGLLLDLAHAADLADAPLRWGRAGLTTPSVAQLVSEDHVLAARAIRRHAADALDRRGRPRVKSGWRPDVWPGSMRLVAKSPCSRRTSPTAGKQRPCVCTTEQMWALHDALPERLRAAVLLGGSRGCVTPRSAG